MSLGQIVQDYLVQLLYKDRSVSFRGGSLSASIPILFISGPAVVAALRAEGIITCSEELTALLEGGVELPSGPHERALRAAAITACDMIVESTSDAFSATELGLYLAMMTEDGQELHGKAKMHVNKCTAY